MSRGHLPAQASARRRPAARTVGLLEFADLHAVAIVRRHAAAGAALPRADPQSLDPAARCRRSRALDAFTREELWGVLQRLWMHRKCTVILVTHELREAVYLCDTVHIMSARPGRIVASR